LGALVGEQQSYDGVRTLIALIHAYRVDDSAKATFGKATTTRQYDTIRQYLDGIATPIPEDSLNVQRFGVQKFYFQCLFIRSIINDKGTAIRFLSSRVGCSPEPFLVDPGNDVAAIIKNSENFDSELRLIGRLIY